MSSSKSVAGRLLKGVGITLAVVLALAVALVAWFYYEITVPDDGDRLADRQGAETAREIAGDLEPGYVEPVDAENLAQRVEDGYRQVTVLGWDGDSGTDDGAVIEVAIRTEVPGSSSEWFDPGVSSGSSLTCWRFTVRAFQHDGEADHDEIGCPDDLDDAPAPDPTPLPSLDPEAEETVLRVLDGLGDDATPEAAESALRAELADFVDVRVERGSGELVAAVGVLRSRDCIVGVSPDGEPAWRFSDFRRIQLEPGEGGCTPGLYLAPVTTH